MSLPVPPLLKPVLGKPVAIFGAGLSGIAVRKLLEKANTASRIYDEASGDRFDEAHCAEHALVVFSPGFAMDHPWLRIARSCGLRCLGELDFSALFWRQQLRSLRRRGELIAVTGTNGKTTLTEFLTHALLLSGAKAHAVGNIGKPLAQLVLENEGLHSTALGTLQIAVCEVSSFQAESLQHFRADALLWTNFSEDHLDRHRSLENYFSAKARLLAATPVDSTFAGSCVARAAREFDYQLPPYAAMRCEGPFLDEELEGTDFAEPPQRDNFRLALAWWRHTNRSPDCLHNAARTFTLGRHRLSLLVEVGGVSYWDDSKATNFSAVEGALARFAQTKTPVNLILGGRSKGGDLPGFVARIAPRVAHAFLIGETAPALAPLCESAGLAHMRCESLEAAVRAAHTKAQPGEAILLSPGFASFDNFRDYRARGEAFEAAVRALVQNSPATKRFFYVT